MILGATIEPVAQQTANHKTVTNFHFEKLCFANISKTIVKQTFETRKKLQL